MRGEFVTADSSYAKRMVRNPQRRARAAIVVLARNQDCDDVLLSMARMEQRFNHKFNYPYVFLNNGEFHPDFQNRYAAILRPAGWVSTHSGRHLVQMKAL